MPRILITNDDSIYAEGIHDLIRFAASYGDLFIVAPDIQKSACSHAMSISTPLRVKQLEIMGHEAYAVNGTPADCAKLAMNALMDEKPDLVLSGINHGSNAGINAVYSGTVAGAVEGAIVGIPSMAVSCTSYEAHADRSGIKEAFDKLIPWLLEQPPTRGVTLNLNAPAGPLKELKWTHQAQSYYEERFEKRKDPFGQDYYWVSGELINEDEDPETDLVLLEQGFATVTPISYDLTNMDYLNRLKKMGF